MAVEPAQVRLSSETRRPLACCTCGRDVRWRQGSRAVNGSGSSAAFPRRDASKAYWKGASLEGRSLGKPLIGRVSSPLLSPHYARHARLGSQFCILCRCSSFASAGEPLRHPWERSMVSCVPRRFTGPSFSYIPRPSPQTSVLFRFCCTTVTLVTLIDYTSTP
jgi:hypothetical protein